jgi:2-polyprenyl-3-methyl-5-hydroxy-6-metoxy-1,4-benzoquinol methylase
MGASKMIQQVEDFLLKFLRSHGPFENILDVGCRDINGNLTTIMKQHKIKGHDKVVGIDMVMGMGVNKVLNAHDLRVEWPEPEFDLVVSTETLEHDPRPWGIVENMRDVLKPGGWMVLTVPGINCQRHDEPKDYYRFFEGVFKKVFFEGFEEVYIHEGFWEPGKEQEWELRPDAVLGWGRKP